MRRFENHPNALHVAAAWLILGVQFWTAGTGSLYPAVYLAPPSYLISRAPDSTLLDQWLAMYEQALDRQAADDTSAGAGAYDLLFQAIREELPDTSGVQGILYPFSQNTDALDIVHLAAIYLQYRSIRQPMDGRDMEQLDRFIRLYLEKAPANAHRARVRWGEKFVYHDAQIGTHRRDPSWRIRPVTRAYIMVDSLRYPFGVPQHGEYDRPTRSLFSKLSKQSAALPGSDRVWVLAMNLFFYANHLSHLTRPLDEPDILEIATELPNAIRILNEDDQTKREDAQSGLGESERQALMIGILRCAAYFHDKFIARDGVAEIETPSASMTKGIAAIQRLIESHAGMLSRWLGEIYQTTAGFSSTHLFRRDPLLAGLRWRLWADVEPYFRYVHDEADGRDLAVEELLLVRKPRHFDVLNHVLLEHREGDHRSGYDVERGEKIARGLEVYLSGLAERVGPQLVRVRPFDPAPTSI